MKILLLAEYMLRLSFSLFNSAASTENYSLNLCDTRGFIVIMLDTGHCLR
jgi:hypothetical protein